MTEKQKLQIFIDNNSENLELEYKLKPNFSEIKNAIEHVTKRMHFNILKTIYAFANTEGGTLYIGIDEHKEDNDIKKRTIVGVDNSDKKLIEGLFNNKRISKKITIKKEFINLEPEKRTVIKIVVNKLKLYDKPQLLDGILYFRKADNTKFAQLGDWRTIYIDKQFYLYYLEGVRDNLHKIKTEQDNFMAEQFITGLKNQIKKIANKNRIIDDGTMKKAMELLDEIQKGIIEKINLKSTTDELVKQEQPADISIDKTIDDFIKTYKAIVGMGV